MPDNPLAGSSDPNARRIIAYGLRNPFRFTIRPGTSEVWLGDVGWSTWEEINRIADPLGPVENFGWPCYEGRRQPPARLRQREPEHLREPLCAAAGAVVAPYYAYNHNAKVVPGESCRPTPTAPTSSSIAGIAFYPGGPFPDSYDGALFFADYSRNCIWVMFRGRKRPSRPEQPGDVPGSAPRTRSTSRSAPTARSTTPTSTAARSGGSHSLRQPAADRRRDGVPDQRAGAADRQLRRQRLERPGGWAADLRLGPRRRRRVRRLDCVTADPSPTRSRARTTCGSASPTPQGASATSAPITISADNTPPTASIDAPARGTTWRVGDTHRLLRLGDGPAAGDACPRPPSPGSSSCSTAPRTATRIRCRRSPA